MRLISSYMRQILNPLNALLIQSGLMFDFTGSHRRLDGMNC